jgi:hypothetical protein
MLAVRTGYATRGNRLGSGLGYPEAHPRLTSTLVIKRVMASQVSSLECLDISEYTAVDGYAILVCRVMLYPFPVWPPGLEIYRDALGNVTPEGIAVCVND